MVNGLGVPSQPIIVPKTFAYSTELALNFSIRNITHFLCKPNLILFTSFDPTLSISQFLSFKLVFDSPTVTASCWRPGLPGWVPWGPVAWGRPVSCRASSAWVLPPFWRSASRWSPLPCLLVSTWWWRLVPFLRKYIKIKYIFLQFCLREVSASLNTAKISFTWSETVVPFSSQTF